MPDLTELQRLAEGATPGPWKVMENSWSHTAVIAGDDCICALDINHATEETQEALEAEMAANAGLIAAMSPDTAKKLIAVARAGEKALEFFTTYSMLNESEQDEMDLQKTATLGELRTALEELAGSPQERRE